MDALKKLHKVLKQDQALNKFVTMLDKLSPLFLQRSPEQLSQSKQLQLIKTQLQQMKLTQIDQSFRELPPIPEITAIIIKASKQFTLALLMIPLNKYFGWHDHAKMNGISKIVSGKLHVKSINPQHLYKCGQANQNTFLYPLDRIREQNLQNCGQKISVIYPDSYNIHQIFGLKQSCFLDLLIPQYPDNSCHYFRTCQEPIIQGETEDKIKIMMIKNSYQQIIGLKELAKIFKENQKPTAKQLKAK